MLQQFSAHCQSDWSVGLCSLSPQPLFIFLSYSDYELTSVSLTVMLLWFSTQCWPVVDWLTLIMPITTRCIASIFKLWNHLSDTHNWLAYPQVSVIFCFPRQTPTLGVAHCLTGCLFCFGLLFPVDILVLALAFFYIANFYFMWICQYTNILTFVIILI